MMDEWISEGNESFTHLFKLYSLRTKPASGGKLGIQDIAVNQTESS